MPHLAGAAVAIWEELQNLLKSPHISVFNLLSNLPELMPNAQSGDSYEVPSVGAMTINANGAADATADDPSVSNLTLNIDLEPSIVVRLSRRRQAQMLGGKGKWAEELAKQADTNMTNYLDREVLDYLLGLCFSTSGAYWQNPGGLTITRNHLLAGKAYLAGQRGATGKYVVFMDSWCESAVRGLIGFTATQMPTAEAALLATYGVEVIGKIDGLVIVITNENPGSQARGQRTVDVTGSVITGTTTQTLTVPEGHGIVPGNFVTVSNMDAAHNNGPLAVASVTATTVVLQSTGLTNGTSVDTTGTLTVRCAINIMVDAGHCWKGMTDEVQVKVVELPNNTGANLVVSPLYGRIARQGRVVAIGSPFASLTQA